MTKKILTKIIPPCSTVAAVALRFQSGPDYTPESAGRNSSEERVAAPAVTERRVSSWARKGRMVLARNSQRHSPPNPDSGRAAPVRTRPRPLRLLILVYRFGVWGHLPLPLLWGRGDV